MPSHLILIRQSGLRAVSKEDVRAALDDDRLRLEHEWVDLDMRPFADDVSAGVWGEQDRMLREHAAMVCQLADGMEDPELHYFGLAEVPQIVALGAYLGLERKVVVHEFDRAEGKWRWPGGEPLGFVVDGPVADTVIPQRGSIALQIELSYPVSASDVVAAIGDENFPPVRVRPSVGEPGLGRIRSPADVESARLAIRGALAKIRSAYPNLDAIHLFAAVPTSVAFVVGQELVPRNSPPVQTYRYRASSEDQAQKRAILIQQNPLEAEECHLEESDRAHARELRSTLWAEELDGIKAYARTLGQEAASGEWFSALRPRAALASVQPFSRLARLADLPADSRVEREPYAIPRDFRYAEGVWQLSDELVLNLCDGIDETEARRRIRLFLLHEQLHHHHMITSDTADEVGKFPNALEHVDYTADFFAIAHELDRAIRSDQVIEVDDAQVRSFLVECIESVLRSFWAFERAGRRVWEIRRLRRHFNWHWQLARVGSAQSLDGALRMLSSKPVVELAGLRARARGRRFEVDLLDRLPDVTLEIAIVLEDESLDRRGSGGGTDPTRLCQAMIDRDHAGVKSFFRALERFARERKPRGIV